MDLELRHLKVVCAIADAGSVTKAATILGLPQPALTTQLQRIERVFGAALFDRDQRGARPTALGDLVLARARVLLPVVHDLEHEAAKLAMSDQPDNGMQVFRIGAVHGPLLPGILHRFAAEYPSGLLTTYATWSVDELARMLLDGRLDFALAGRCGGTPPPDDGVIWHEIAVDAVCVLVSSDHPKAATEADLAEFADEAFAVARGEGGCFDDCFAMACARAGFAPKTMYELDPAACLELVETGDAVGLSQGGFRRAASVAAVPLRNTPLRWRHMLAWNPNGPGAELADRLLEFARESYQAAVERSPRYAAWLAEHPGFGLSEILPDRVISPQ